MRLGIGSHTFGWAVEAKEMSAIDLVDIAVDWKVRCVQLGGNLPADTFAEPRLLQLREYARSKRIELEVGTEGSQPDHLRRMIGVARELSSPVLRVMADCQNDHPSTEQVVARIGEIMPDLRAAGIALAIENHDRFSSESLAWIVGQLQCDQVGICLDVASALAVPEGPRQVVKTLGPYVVNLRIRDFVIRRPPSGQGLVVEGRPAGEGQLDVPWLLRELDRFGKTQSAIIELWTEPGATIQETISLQREWAKRSVTHARKWIRD